MSFSHTLSGTKYRFPDLKTLLAKATPTRSGDELAGVAATSREERVAAQLALADLPLRQFLSDAVVPYESDEVTRLIIDSHDANAFEPLSAFTVGDFREWLLEDQVDHARLALVADGLTPEMVAAVSKIMRVQDLICVAAKCRVITSFRNTMGLPGRFSTRLQPNHPTDNLSGIAASIIDGLLNASGDAVIGVNPATDDLEKVIKILCMLDEIRLRLNAPIQSCVLAHISTMLAAIERGAPVDLIFQSIAGTEAANRAFGLSLAVLDEAYESGKQLKRGSIGNNFMYFETGQGSALSSGANFNVDQQTLEVRAYAIARRYHPLLINSVVGFIGPEYLFDGKQIIRAGLEDHFCGKLLGLPMGCDVCFTNHAETDQDDMDELLTLLAVAGCTYVMGVPGADDIMLNYQSTSFQDALYVRHLLGLRSAPEFEQWLYSIRLIDKNGRLNTREHSKLLNLLGDLSFDET
jgi:ethanolamine ammonia-lyase large subunit